MYCYLFDTRSDLFYLQINNCLREWQLGYFYGEGYYNTFSSENYGSILDGILDVIRDINKDRHHKAKWDANRRQWAKDGM